MAGNIITDNHHLLWPRKEWNKNKWSSKLRQHPYLKIEIPADCHRMLHSSIMSVPLADEDVCKRACMALDVMWAVNGINKDDSAKTRIKIITTYLSESSPTCIALRAQEMFV